MDSDCDLKSSHAFLDDYFHAKLSDFGLAMLGPAQPRRVGPSGYMAPKHFGVGLSRKEIGVCSFGVALTELLSGRPAVDESQEGEDRCRALRTEPHLVMARTLHCSPAQAHPGVIHRDLKAGLKASSISLAISLLIFALLCYFQMNQLAS